MKKHLTLLCIFCLSAMLSMAQEEQVKLPYSFRHENISMVVNQVDMPQLNIPELLKEDAAHSSKTDLYRIGVGFDVNANMNNTSSTEITSDGGKLWRNQFNTEGAYMTYLVFEDFNIPEEAELYIYSPDQDQVFGPYTNKDVQSVGRFESDNIIGDKLVVEYYEPANVSFHGHFNIAAVMHIYKDFLHTRSEEKGPHGNAQGTCHPDVVCPEGQPWHYPINSVVCLEMTAYASGQWGTYMCSGAMINNVRMDKTPYVLSADHCVAANDQTYKFYFNYQVDECGGSSSSTTRYANGGTIVARSNTPNDLTSSSDFLLLRITGNIHQTYRDSIFFAGWDRSGSSSAGSCIHHPGGDWKKISLVQSVYNASGYGNRFFAVKWMTNPNKGVTEQGSSGSPLFNNSSLIIGTLTGGYSFCYATDQSDLYGKFSNHWLNNNATANDRKLQPWLDPDNTGTTVLQGMTYSGQVITGVQEHTQYNTFSVAPNPTRDGMITIQGDFMNENAICNIYNVMGQLVMTQNVITDSSFNMNVSSLDNGMYFIELIGADRTYKSKLIISK